MTKETADILQAIADKLGVAAEYLWAALLRQAPIAGMADLVWYAALIVGWAIFAKGLKLSKKWYDTSGEYSRDASIYIPISLVGLLLSIITMIALDHLPITLAAFFNPPYWALKEILPE